MGRKKLTAFQKKKHRQANQARYYEKNIIELRQKGKDSYHKKKKLKNLEKNEDSNVNKKLQA